MSLQDPQDNIEDMLILVNLYAIWTYLNSVQNPVWSFSILVGWEQESSFVGCDIPWYFPLCIYNS